MGICQRTVVPAGSGLQRHHAGFHHHGFQFGSAHLFSATNSSAAHLPHASCACRASPLRTAHSACILCTITALNAIAWLACGSIFPSSGLVWRSRGFGALFLLAYLGAYYRALPLLLVPWITFRLHGLGAFHLPFASPALPVYRSTRIAHLRHLFWHLHCCCCASASFCRTALHARLHFTFRSSHAHAPRGWIVCWLNIAIGTSANSGSAHSKLRAHRHRGKIMLRRAMAFINMPALHVPQQTA